MIILDSTDVYDEYFNQSHIETEEDFENQELLWCDECTTNGIHLTSEDDLIDHGFNPSEAPYGICISCAIDYGKLQDDNLDKNDYTNTEFFHQVGNKTLAMVLKRRKLTDQEVSDGLEREKSIGYYRDFSNKYKLKSLYRSAITEERYRKMSPPYFVGNRLRYHGIERFHSVGTDDLKSNYELAKMKVEKHVEAPESEVERPTPMEFRRDWFDSLIDSFMLHEMDNAGRPNKRLAYALICTYLHKSWDWNNVEPFWVFARRMSIGNIQLMRKMDNWINPITNYHIAQIESLSIEPSLQTITNLVGIIIDHSHDVFIRDEESQQLIQASANLLKRLREVEINIPKGNGNETKSLLEHIHSTMKFQNSFSIQNHEFFAAGSIEALCISYCAENILGLERRNVLHRKFLFPKLNGFPWWKKELTSDAVRIIENFDKIIGRLQT